MYSNRNFSFLFRDRIVVYFHVQMVSAFVLYIFNYRNVAHISFTVFSLIRKTSIDRKDHGRLLKYYEVVRKPLDYKDAVAVFFIINYFISNVAHFC